LLSAKPAEFSSALYLKGVKTCFFILSESPAYTAVRCYVIVNRKAKSTPATMSKQHSTLSKRLNINAKPLSTLLLPFLGNKVDRYFDIVAGVDGV